jgi:predicted aconitase with swiveling domain
MAKAKGSSTASKVTFGARKAGKAKKSFNKHTPRPKKYIGQGR